MDIFSDRQQLLLSFSATGYQLFRHWYRKVQRTGRDEGEGWMNIVRMPIVAGLSTSYLLEKGPAPLTGHPLYHQTSASTDPPRNEPDTSACVITWVTHCYVAHLEVS
jgi:hypothetical protein